MDTPKVFKQHYPDPGKNLLSFCIVGAIGGEPGGDAQRKAMGDAIREDFPDLDHAWDEVNIMEGKDGNKGVFTFTAWTKRVPDTYERKSGVPTNLMNKYYLTRPLMDPPDETNRIKNTGS